MSGYKSVTNSTDLALALYEDAREMVLSGPLASGIYHGCKSIRRLRICVVLFGILGLGCVTILKCCCQHCSYFLC